jgi:gas vesicle protein
MKDHRRRGGALRTAAAFTLGAAAGSIMALLYAPASGQVTRRRLAGKGQGLRREAARRLGRTKKVIATQAVQVREAASEWIAEHVPHANGNGRHTRRPVRHAAR